MHTFWPDDVPDRWERRRSRAVSVGSRKLPSHRLGRALQGRLVTFDAAGRFSIREPRQVFVVTGDGRHARPAGSAGAGAGRTGRPTLCGARSSALLGSGLGGSRLEKLVVASASSTEPGEAWLKVPFLGELCEFGRTVSARWKADLQFGQPIGDHRSGGRRSAGGSGRPTAARGTFRQLVFRVAATPEVGPQRFTLDGRHGLAGTFRAVVAWAGAPRRLRGFVGKV